MIPHFLPLTAYSFSLAYSGLVRVHHSQGKESLYIIALNYWPFEKGKISSWGFFFKSSDSSREHNFLTWTVIGLVFDIYRLLPALNRLLGMNLVRLLAWLMSLSEQVDRVLATIVGLVKLWLVLAIIWEYIAGSCAGTIVIDVLGIFERRSGDNDVVSGNIFGFVIGPVVWLWQVVGGRVLWWDCCLPSKFSFNSNCIDSTPMFSLEATHHSYTYPLHSP